MKRFIYTILLVCTGIVSGQEYKFSFPSPEIRVDTLKPLSAYRLSVIKPLDVTGSLTIKGTRAPSMFMLECVDSLNHHRFAITKNGYLVSGTHHNPTTNIDALAMMGRGNTVLGADAMAIGKQVVNEADTTMALGYYYTVPEGKHNMTIIGYGGNRIEMAADSGRFVGNWKLGGSGSGGITTETDPTVGTHIKNITTTNKNNWNSAFSWGDHAAAGYLKNYTETDPTIPVHVKNISTANVTNWNSAFGWGNHSTQGYLKTEADPLWTTDKVNYYSQVQTKALVKDTAAVLRSLIKTAGGGSVPVFVAGTVTSQPLPAGEYAVMPLVVTKGDANMVSDGTTITIPKSGIYTISMTPGTLPSGSSSTYSTIADNTTGNKYGFAFNSWNETTPSITTSVYLSAGQKIALKIWTEDAQTGITGVLFSCALVSEKVASGSGGITEETDPTVPSHVKSITTANVTNWNTAFSWGNHATQGYLKNVPTTTLSDVEMLKRKMSGDPVVYTFANLDVSGGYGTYFVKTTNNDVSFPVANLNSQMDNNREITIYWQSAYYVSESENTTRLKFPSSALGEITFGYGMVTGTNGFWTMKSGIYYIKVYKNGEGLLTIMVLPKPQWP